MEVAKRVEERHQNALRIRFLPMKTIATESVLVMEISGIAENADDEFLSRFVSFLN